MSPDPSRVRGGEWLIGIAGLALLVILFALPWYGFTTIYSVNALALGVRVSYDAWQSLDVVRFFVLILAFGGILTWWLQATRTAPAIPICAVVLETLLGLVVLALLIWRGIDPPGGRLFEAKSGAYLGPILAAAIVAGGYISMRQDRGGSPQQIETVRLTPRQSAPSP